MYYGCRHAKWELYQMGALPYKTNGNFIRWEPYHIKQMGTLSGGSPTAQKAYKELWDSTVPFLLIMRIDENAKIRLILHRFKIHTRLIKD